MENVTIMDHPLIQHKISRLRDKTTGTNEFRTLVSEIAMLMGFEALRDLPTELVEIETPIETTKQPMIAGKKMAIVPDGKPSQTEWKVIERLKGATYLDVHLLTGRTHQIRVHMHSIGHPLLGDRIYAPNIRTSVHIPRLMLHAYSLAFTHPATGERMTLCAPLPEKFETTLEKLRQP